MFNETWIRDQFAKGQQQYDQIADWMNQLPMPQNPPLMMNGIPISPGQFGQNFRNQLSILQPQSQQPQQFQQPQPQSIYGAALGNTQQPQVNNNIYGNRLSDITEQATTNRQNLQTQTENFIRQGERNRVRNYMSTGGGYNRAGLRIQNLNV